MCVKRKSDRVQQVQINHFESLRPYTRFEMSAQTAAHREQAAYLTKKDRNLDTFPLESVPKFQTVNSLIPDPQALINPTEDGYVCSAQGRPKQDCRARNRNLLPLEPTWISESCKAAASFLRSEAPRYFWRWKVFSNRQTWSEVKAVRARRCRPGLPPSAAAAARSPPALSLS